MPEYVHVGTGGTIDSDRDELTAALHEVHKRDAALGEATPPGEITGARWAGEPLHIVIECPERTMRESDIVTVIENIVQNGRRLGLVVELHGRDPECTQVHVGNSGRLRAAADDGRVVRYMPHPERPPTPTRVEA